MADKAAKIRSYGTYVYKNSAWKTISGKVTKKNDYIDQYIYMPDINELQDGVISKMSKVTIDGSDMYIIEEKESEPSALDFGDHAITFMHCNRQQGDKRLGATKELIPTFDKQFIDEDLYGLGAPVSLSYETYMDQTYLHSFASIVPQTIEYNMYAFDAAAQRYKGTKKRALSAKYSAEDDAFLIPFAQDTPFYTYPKGVNHNGTTNHVGYGLTREGVGSFGQGKPLDRTTFTTFKAKTKIDDQEVYFWQMIASPGMYYDGGYIYRVFISIQDGKEYSINLKANQDNIRYYLADYAFLYDDKNKNLYILMSLYYEKNGVDYIKTIIAPIDAFVVLEEIDRPFVGTLAEQLSGLLGVIINADDIPDFDDGAPDISGPGDPYNTDEFNNIGSSVGGNADPGKDLNSVDATPNTAFNRFMQATGFFGSYVLSNEDLVEYTNTLKMLYSHASDIFFGEAASLQADRITKNTIGLHMLPLTIPPDDFADTIFSMGNVGIAATDNYSDYKVGNNYAHANYLTKLTRTFNVPLGTIKHNYDNFLDFAPYSSASLYIPYIGKVELPINLIQSTSSDSRPLRLEFRVDYTSGDFMVILFCNINGVDIALSHWNGNCARTVKVSVNDDSSAIIAGANRLASMFSASMSMTSGSSNFGGTLTGSNSNVRNNYYEDKKMNSNMNLDQTSSGKTGGMTFSTPSAPTSVTTNQHMIGNGSADGELGYLGIQDIVLTVERPVWWKPYDYGNLIGYPTKKVAKLASVKGFARVSDAHIRCTATATEKDEIATLLAEGVIF